VSSPLVSRVVPRGSLDECRRREMLALMHVCYEGVTAERFAADLDEKQLVILLFARAGRELVGFSTVRIAEERLGGRRVDLVYSGDTVIHPDFWGAKSLQAAFGRLLLARKLRRPLRPCLWLLLSAGYKTYLLMVRNFPRSFPSRTFDPDSGRKAFLERVAQQWFGSQYDPARGILRFRGPHYRVRRGIAPVDARTATNPDVEYYLGRNPAHANGEELVCLAEIRLRDLGWALARIALRQAAMPARREPDSARVGAGT